MAAAETEALLSDKARLFKAAVEGDLEEATGNSGYLRSLIGTDSGSAVTALRVGILAKQEQFVKQILLQHVTDSTRDDVGDLLRYAAISGSVEIARAIVDQELTRPNNLREALLVAGILKHRGMVEYLYEQYLNHNIGCQILNKGELAKLLITCIRIGSYDTAASMLGSNPNLATFKVTLEGNYKTTALKVLAHTPSVFASESTREPGLFNGLVNLCLRMICCGTPRQCHATRLLGEFTNTLIELSRTPENIRKLEKLLLVAAEAGNTEFLIWLIQFNPDLLWTSADNQGGGSILHIAVEKRHQNIVRLFSDLGALKDMIALRPNNDEDGNTILHLAAELAPPEKLNAIYGPALQMYRELLWFKEIEKMVPEYKLQWNTKGETPQILFEKSHKDLREAGEKWMKDTAESSMLVATLIATVMFSAALSVPGDFVKGKPALINDETFIWFSISDAAAMLSSSAAMIMFLSIRVSNYTENHFLKSVPRLLVGAALLYISMTAMLISFALLSYLYYHCESASVTLVVVFLLILYLSQTYRLFLFLLEETYRFLLFLFEETYRRFSLDLVFQLFRGRLRLRQSHKRLFRKKYHW